MRRARTRRPRLPAPCRIREEPICSSTARSGRWAWVWRRPRCSFAACDCHVRAGGAMRALIRPRVLITLTLAALWLAAWCAPALAHARLLQESPASGTSLEEPPQQVRLRFSEPVDAEFDPVRVFDAEGNRVDEDDARVDPDDARVLLAGLEHLPRGSYRVEWRVTSLDGHVVEDAYAFNVAPDAGAAEGGSRSGAQNTG